MMPQILSLSEHYRKQLKQIAWRIQYRNKVRARSEQLSIHTWLETNEYHSFPAEEFDSLIAVQELIDSLPFAQGKQIIRGLYLDQQTEAQLAEQLQISQQAVNRWKRKSLQYLSQKISS